MGILRPNLHRSDQTDVARTEHLTFICSRERDDTGLTNKWMDPREAGEKVGGRDDSVKGPQEQRTPAGGAAAAGSSQPARDP